MISFLFHDVIANGEWAASGFGGNTARRYKLDSKAFEAHLAAIGSALGGQVPQAAVTNQLPPQPGTVALTFDDGGVSAHTTIADQLERRGWRGMFFITTDFTGQPGFLSREQIQDLHRRGHAIGSHSCSHPPLFARQSYAELLQEWSGSRRALEDILGSQVSLASVPGGLYARNVAAAAAECGITALFTSEAVSNHWMVDGCTVFGRYNIQRGTRPAWVAGLAAGERVPRAVEYCRWVARKSLQQVGGPYYHRLRQSILGGSHHP
jgi:peptidoglycan/xylan/chitin deacetylase (PgdA/CDA1 family)